MPRKPLSELHKTVSITFRATEPQAERFHAKGGGLWLRRLIDAEEPKPEASPEEITGLRLKSEFLDRSMEESDELKARWKRFSREQGN